MSGYHLPLADVRFLWRTWEVGDVALYAAMCSATPYFLGPLCS